MVLNGLFLSFVIVSQVQVSTEEKDKVEKPVPENVQALNEEKSNKEDFKLTELEQELVNQCNAYRARCGLRALIPHPILMQRARNHCQVMASQNSMFHSSGIRENVAWGYQSPQAVMSGWINSSGHLANLLSNEVYIGNSGVSNGSSIYWTQQFMSSEPTTTENSYGSTAGSSTGTRRRGLFRRR